MNRVKELLGTFWYSALYVLAFLIIVGGMILAGLAVQKVFLEPQWQKSYTFETTSMLNDWCSASPDDAFNKGTLAALKSKKESQPDRFNALSFETQTSINAAIRGDREGACGR